MSISSRLEAINQHLLDDYSILTLAGADLTNVDKNILNLKQTWEERLLYFLANGTDVVWNNWLPKVTGSGEIITLNNTIEAKMDFVYKGNTYQYSTTGKNLFNVNATHENNLEEAGITATFNSDGTITVNGTKNANYKFISYRVTLPAGTYYFSGCPSGGSGGGYSTIVQTTSEISSQVFDIGNGGTFTLTEERIISFYPVRIGADAVTFNNTVFKPMIARVPVTYNDYEPYTGGIASPNPDYPQDIQVVSGDNEINVCGKNFFDYDNTTLSSSYLAVATKSDNGYLGGWAYIINLQSPIKAGTYYLSYKVNNVDNSTTASMSFRDINNSTLTATNVHRDYSNVITLTKDVYTLRVDNGKNASTTLIKNIMIEKSSSATPYEPYQSASYPINLGVENLWSNQLSGFLPQSGSYPTTNSSYPNARYILINLLKDQSITLSGITFDGSGRVRYIDKDTNQVVGNMTYLDSAYYTATHTFGDGFYEGTITAKKDFIVGIMDLNGNVNNLIVNYGTTPQTISDNPIELCKIGTYQDSIKKSTGKNLFDKDNANIAHKLAKNDLTFNTDSNYVSIYVPAQEGKTYTISSTSNLFDTYASLFFTSEDLSIATTCLSVSKRSSGATSITATAPAGTKYVCAYIMYSNNQTNINNLLSTIQIELGNQVTPYEPYGKVWYLNKQIGKVVLDGSESGWVVGQYGTNSYNLPKNSLKRGSGIENVVLVLCDNFMATSYTKRTTGDNIVYSDRDIQYGLYFRNTAQTSIENWKTWLSAHNTTVYYVLATPTTTEITDTTLISQLEAIKKSYNTQTNISQTNADKPFILDVVALGELEI